MMATAGTGPPATPTTLAIQDGDFKATAHWRWRRGQPPPTRGRIARHAAATAKGRRRMHVSYAAFNYQPSPFYHAGMM